MSLNSQSNMQRSRTGELTQPPEMTTAGQQPEKSCEVHVRECTEPEGPSAKVPGREGKTVIPIEPSTSGTGGLWRSTATMIMTFLLGVALAFSLHGYYSNLDREVVGNVVAQQNALR